MAKYLTIESRDPYGSADSSYFAELIQSLANKANEATLFPVQDGVLPVRQGAKYNETLASLVQNKIEVLTDGFSLREPAIGKLVQDGEVADAAHWRRMPVTFPALIYECCRR